MRACVRVGIPGSQSSCGRSQVWWVGRFHPASRSSQHRGDAPEESLWFPGSKPAQLPRPPKSEDWTNAAQTPQSKNNCLHVMLSKKRINTLFWSWFIHEFASVSVHTCFIPLFSSVICLYCLYIILCFYFVINYKMYHFYTIIPKTYWYVGLQLIIIYTID